MLYFSVLKKLLTNYLRTLFPFLQNLVPAEALESVISSDICHIIGITNSKNLL